MTLGATFKSFTQKQIESEKQLNVTVNNTAMTVKEVKQEVQTVSNDVIVLSKKVDNGYVTNKEFETYKTNANNTFAKLEDLTNYLQTEEANDLFIDKQSFKELVQRVETLENNKEGGNIDG